MKRTYSILLITLFLLVQHSRAQKCVNPHMEAHRLDFRDIGYPAATEIPADDSPVAALLAHSSGRVYGATTGKQSYLFSYDYMTNKVYPLGKIGNEKGVHHSIVEGANGMVYIGTGLNELELLTLTSDIPGGRRTIENQLWTDIKNKYRDFDGGHIYVYDPKKGDADVYLPEQMAKVEDLGVAVTGNSVYAMVINPNKDKIYGISYPDAVFFEFDLLTKAFKKHGEWMTIKSYPGPERSWRGVPRSLVCSADGKVYSSGDNGLMQYYDPATGKIEMTGMRIPGEYWETQNYNAYPVVEQLVPALDGTVYGSTSDGFIFRMNLENETLAVLGKPRVERRVRAMTMGRDQQVYMICGEKDNVCRLFSYDAAEQNGFSDYGVLGVDRSPYYAKIGYQFDSMCTASDGTIFIGESDRRAKLFFYIPGGTIMKGVLNPTNPR
ncbi:MAG: hypothetical protein PHI28_04675 [Mangrovibacterium sp.]|nr:hypothetical protein [Mangrovibacterium sp.]